MLASDADDLLAVFGDPRVMAAFAAQPFDRSAMEHWVERNLHHQRRHGYGLYSIIHRQDGCVIGDCGVEHKDALDGQPPELGYDLRSDYWNQGLATEAAAAVRDHAFGRLGLSRLVSMIRVGNAASRRVAEKIGMERQGEAAVNGVRYLIYSIAASAPV
jgi:RimJ/RimL family protein N-acetyltransferase